MLDSLILTIFPALMIGAAVFDVTTMTIPNWLIVLILAGFVAVAAALGLDPLRIAFHLALFFALLFVGIFCFARGWVGGGDAKLLAAIGLWVGPEQIVTLLLITSVAGGALTIAILFFRQMPLPICLGSQGWIYRLHNPDNGVPYGVALAAGGLAVFTQCQVFLTTASIL